MQWMVAVTVSRGGRRILTEVFQHSPVTIGAHADNDVVLSEPSVSSEHASVIVSAGKLIVEDRSTNGSFIRGERISRRTLESGDTLEIPPFKLDLTLTRLEKKRRTMAGLAFPGEVEAVPQVLPPRAPPPIPTLVASPPRTSALPGVVQETPADEDGLAAVLAATDWDSAPRKRTPAIRLTGPAPAARCYGVCLVIQEPPELAGKTFPVTQRKTRLGRRPDLEIRLDFTPPLSSISRLHASLSQEPDGHYKIKDEGSRNGVFVNGRPVKEAVIRPGDRLGLGGNIVLLFTNIAGPDGE
jgi:pSer/pThr/pTyr-binding forkhead associated (FHA) protein